MITISNLHEADQTLLRIGRLQRDIEAEEIILNDGIFNLKNLSAQRLAPKHEELGAAEEQLLAWIKTNSRDFSDPRSKDLTYGTIGLRDFSPKPRLIGGNKEEDVAKSLLRAGFKQVVNVKYSLIRNALKSLPWPAERFAKFGIKIGQKKNQPFYTIDRAKIAAESNEGTPS